MRFQLLSFIFCKLTNTQIFIEEDEELTVLVSQMEQVRWSRFKRERNKTRSFTLCRFHQTVPGMRRSLVLCRHLSSTCSCVCSCVCVCVCVCECVCVCVGGAASHFLSFLSLLPSVSSSSDCRPGSFFFPLRHHHLQNLLQLHDCGQNDDEDEFTSLRLPVFFAGFSLAFV